MFTLILLSSCGQEKKDDLPWVELFDGKTLNGWTSIGGDATYEVNEGTIIGISKLNTPNTFLRSDEIYGDFILELEYKVDPKLNSGI